MQFRTPTDIKPYDFSIGYSTPGLLAGSCFAENIAARMERVKLPVSSNPFGVLFNPASIVNMFDRLHSRHEYGAGDLVASGGLWASLDHHGRFSAPDRDTTLREINRAVETGAEKLASAEYVVITFGTAWVYEYRETGRIAANCHKLPADMFNRRRLSVGEIAGMFEKPLDTYLKDKKVIFTVSPIRHIKDGLAENQLSKATLLVAVHELLAAYRNCYYFPAYEMVVDDLRDYRFYDADMVHPSQVAVDYIWEHFCGAAVEQAALRLMKRIERITTAAEHRVFTPGSDSHKAFCRNNLESIRQIAEEHPGLDFSKEIKHFGG